MILTAGRLKIMCLAAAFFAALGACRAQDIEQARATILATADAVVVVDVVLEAKVSYEGRTEREQHKASVNATFIDPSGLAVTALSEVDPSGFEDFTDESDELNYSVDVAGLKLRLEDGTEMAADIVGRDPELDLAFIRPKQVPSTPVRFVDLSKSQSPRILDEIVVVSRLGKAGSESLSASVERIQSVVTKPRTFFVIYNFCNRGCPVLTFDGKAVGITVRRSVKSEGSGHESFSDYEELDIVMPAEAVLQAAAKLSGTPRP